LIYFVIVFLFRTINLRNLILRIGNNREDLIDEESRNIRNFLKIDQNGNEIPLLAVKLKSIV